MQRPMTTPGLAPAPAGQAPPAGLQQGPPRPMMSSPQQPPGPPRPMMSPATPLGAGQVPGQMPGQMTPGHMPPQMGARPPMAGGMPPMQQQMQQQQPPRPGMSMGMSPPPAGMSQARGPPMPMPPMAGQAPPMPMMQQQQQPPQQQPMMQPPMAGSVPRPPAMMGMHQPQQAPPMGMMQPQQAPPPMGMMQPQQQPPPMGMMQPQQQYQPPMGQAMGGAMPMMQQQQQHAAGSHGYAQPPSKPRFVINPALQCDRAFMRTTFGSVAASGAMMKQSAVPMGVIVQPLAELGRGVPVVPTGAGGIVRCRACRAYVNPFVQWLDNGRRWLCNFCQRDNETGSQYYSHLDAEGQRVDVQERPELSQGCVELVASQEYMVRPPQAPVYVFVLDVSFDAVQSGMLTCAVEAIKRSLDRLPGSPRTQVALLTFDYAVHFYNLNSGLTQPKMLVVSDVDDLFLPCPEDLLVNLADSRQSFEMLLDSLPRLHARNATHEVASGSALQAAFRVMVHIGGKMLMFLTKLPSLGVGKLAGREDARALGTDKEHLLFKSASAFYQTEGQEMNVNNSTLELFVSPARYCDLASLCTTIKTTGGQLHFYPRFSAAVQGRALMADVERSLTRETSWEAVYRLRASHGLSIKSYAGNFMPRTNDLLQVPNLDADAALAIELQHGEAPVGGEAVFLQGALLYTSSSGERRIRVMTLARPVTAQVADVLHSADQETTAVFIAKRAADEAPNLGLIEVRNKLMNFSVNVLRASRLLASAYAPYGGGMGMRPPGQQQQQQQQQQSDLDALPPSLQMLPLYAMALSKNAAFRGGDQVSLDERVAALQNMLHCSAASVATSALPRMYELHNLAPDTGRPVACVQGETAAVLAAEGMARLPGPEEQKIRLPPLVPLSAQSLRSDGLFLVDAGFQLLLWVGRGLDPRLVQALFGVPSLDGIDAGVLRVELQPGDGDVKRRTCNVIDALRLANSAGAFKQLAVFKEGDPLEYKFRFSLVEDRAPFNGGSMSYDEYVAHCSRLSRDNAAYSQQLQTKK